MKRLLLLLPVLLLSGGCRNSSDNAGRVPARSGGYRFRVPVLCYHSVGSRVKGRFSVSEADFRAQMEYLYLNGFTVLPLERLVDFVEAYRSGRRGIFLPRRPVVITFDDNYADIQRIAWPVLRRYGFPAYNFIYVKFMTPSRWSFYRQYLRQGMGFGGHTLTHADLTRLLPGESARSYRRRILHELEHSRQIISDRLRSRIRYLAYPYGVYNRTVIRLTRLAGYRAAFSALGGYVTGKSSLDALPRFTVFRDFDLKTFKLIVNGGWSRALGIYGQGKQDFHMRDYNFDY